MYRKFHENQTIIWIQGKNGLNLIIAFKTIFYYEIDSKYRVWDDTMYKMQWIFDPKIYKK